MVNIIEKLSTRNCNLNSNNPQYIIIHETDNQSKGANAKAHASAQSNGNIGKASVHYYVDDHSIYKCLEHKHGSWNCGDGAGKYGIHNNNTISIEICVNSDGDYNKAVTNCIDLVRYLKGGYYSNCKIVRHYDASRKWCPRKILDSNYWNTFLKRVETGDITSSSITNTHIINRNCNVASDEKFTKKIDELKKGQKCYIKYTNPYGNCLIGYNGKQGIVPAYCLSKIELKATHYINSKTNISVYKEMELKTKFGELVPGEKVEYVYSNGRAAYIKFGKGILDGCVEAKYITEIGAELPKEDVQESYVAKYKVQVGAFSNKENAESMVKELKEKGINGIIKEE